MRAPRIGALRHRVELQEAVRTDEEGGAAGVVWQPLAAMWASVEAGSGAEIVAEDGRKARATHRVTTRYAIGIQPGRRFRFEHRLLRIEAVADLDGRGRFLLAVCEEELA